MGMATLRRLCSNVASKGKIKLASSPALERKSYHNVSTSKASNPRTDPNTKIGAQVSNPRKESTKTTTGRRDFEARRDIQDIGRNQLTNPRTDPYTKIGTKQMLNPRTDSNTKIGTQVSNPSTESTKTTDRKDFEARRDIQDIGRNQLTNPRIDPYTKIGTKQMLNPRTDSNTKIGTQVSNPSTESTKTTDRKDFEAMMYIKNIGRNKLYNPRVDSYTKIGTERLSNPMRDPLPPNTKIGTRQLDPRTNPKTKIGIQVSNNNTYPKLQEIASKALYGCKEFVKNDIGVKTTLYSKSVGSAIYSKYQHEGGDVFQTNVGVKGEISYTVNSPSIFGIKSSIEVGKDGVEFSLSSEDKIGSSISNGIKISPGDVKVFGTTSETTLTGYTSEIRIEKDVPKPPAVAIAAACITVAYSVSNKVRKRCWSY